MLEEYKNSSSPLRYICKCGHENITSFCKFKQQKNGCRYCTKIGGYNNEEVHKYFKDNNCELLENYKGIKEIHKYKCVCGNISYITFDNFKQGRRCKQCGFNKLSMSNREDIEYVRLYFNNNNCIPLFETYINDRQKLKYKCICGNITTIRFCDFKRGRRCKKCSLERANNTKYKYSTSPTSSQQYYIYSLINGILNYPVGSFLLDIAFPEEKIYVGYDGSGHDLSVKLKTMSESDFQEKEKRRNYFLWRRNWKGIRIISKNDNLPSDNKIIEMIKLGRDILKNRSWVVFDIDNQELSYSGTKLYYDYEKTKRFRND